MELSQYLDLFISEAQDHLQDMNHALLALEKKPDDLGHLEAFFRAAHTLKGMSAALGFPRMAGLAHDLEDILDLLRRKERRLTPELTHLLFRGLDTLSALLQRVAAGAGDQGDTTELQQLLAEARGGAPAEVAALPPTGFPEAGWEIRVEIAPDCVLKGPRAFLVLKRLAEVSPVLGSDPPEAELRAGRYEDRFGVYLAPAADPTALEKAVLSVAEVTAVAVRPIGKVAAPPPAPVAPPSAGPTPEQTPAPAAAPVVRIKVAILDRLLETVADLMINRSRLVQLARRYSQPDLDEAIESYTTLLNRLQETVLSMRMTPVAQVFNRFPRMVRDLAHQQGKEVRFEMEGTEIELDRTVLEKITDPLVHLLRNAVDHGVEPPEVRRQRGKPSAATVRLRAQRVQDKAIIEVSDDGAGMSPTRIAHLAVERGLITAEEAAAMDETAVLELICRPGFSTKAEVSGVSGRGVGMEVVKAAMDKIGGTLEIESSPGQGSCFRMSLPLSMAILPALLVREEGEIYALPLTHVVRTLEPRREEVRLLHHQPVCDWDGRLLPLSPLAEALTPGRRKDLGAYEAETLAVVVAERGRQRYGLVVDEILGKEEIVLKPLGAFLQQIGILAGATIRGEGEVVLVLDIPALVRRLARGESPDREAGGGAR